VVSFILPQGEKEGQSVLSLFFQKAPKHIKSILPVPGLEHRLVFKKGAVDTIKQVKGWRSDADMARALGLTRQYVCMMKKTRVGVTSTVITRLAVQMGSTSANWWVFYEVIPWGVSDPDHPVWNQAKYAGEQPYTSKLASSYQHRSKTQYPSVEARKDF
jgi:hypothetical protein